MPKARHADDDCGGDGGGDDGGSDDTGGGVDGGSNGVFSENIWFYRPFRYPGNKFYGEMAA